MTEKAVAVQTAPATAASGIRVVEPKSVLERMHNLHEEIERRAAEIFRSNSGLFDQNLENWLKAEAELLHPVHISVTESDSELRAKAEVPGFEAKDLSVSLEPHRLTISGKRESHKEETEKGKTVYTEHCSNEILRMIDLPAEIDASKTTATLKNGILELTMPKAAGAKKVEAKTA